MKIELRQLVDENEMLSHIFLGCIPKEELINIKKKYVGVDGKEKDWRKESVKIPVEMKIGGVSLNPKNFFDSWKNQMQQLILEKAQALVAEKLGSEKMRQMQNKLYEYEQILQYWEKDINWEVENPLIEKTVIGDLCHCKKTNEELNCGVTLIEIEHSGNCKKCGYGYGGMPE